MNASSKNNVNNDFRDKIATVDKKGERIWIYAKKPKGTFYNYRKIVSYFLLLVLFAGPFLSWNGEPFFLFNIVDSRFILFGFPFTTQDFHILVIGMLLAIVGIALFTVVYGRVFCGWVCPQTIFMEMVFRRIEYWIEGDANAQKRLNKKEWNSEKVLKKLAKHFLFILISSFIAHTFLAYIIGVEKVWELLTDPIHNHWSGFVSMVVFTAVFYGVFSIMREQVCTTICPYGRLQSVLLDKDSLAVSYDFIRGEPRGKLNKKKTSCTNPNPCDGCKTKGNSCATIGESLAAFIEPEPQGDCVDCNLCVQVCPTGIDIRNGTQLECVNCTACIDACDEVMLKIKKPTGLIRIDSFNGINEGKRKIFSKKAIGYSLVLVLLMAVESFMIVSRTSVECLILRTPGMTYQDVGDGYISNLYNYQLINKTRKEFPVEFIAPDFPYLEIIPVAGAPIAKSNQVSEGALFLKFPKDKTTLGSIEIKIEVVSDAKVIDHTKTTFYSPSIQKDE